MHHILRAALLVAVLLFAGAGMVQAAEVSESVEFALDDWYDLDATDGGVTLHRLRLETKEGRLTKSALSRPHNQEFLETIAVQLEYSNESDRKWKARIDIRWLDADGNVIDGFSANEGLAKKSARKVTGASLSTLKYGIEKAATLEIEIHYEP